MKPEELWAEYTGVHPDGRTYTAWHFHHNQADADALADLVCTGRKRGTASCSYAYVKEEEPFPREGDVSVITDWAGEARCIIETVRAEIVPWREVSAAFAALEGEGDASLEHWRETHRDFFLAECAKCGQAFTTETPVVCEEFRVLWPEEYVTRHDREL